MKNILIKIIITAFLLFIAIPIRANATEPSPTPQQTDERMSWSEFKARYYGLQDNPAFYYKPLPSSSDSINNEQQSDLARLFENNDYAFTITIVVFCLAIIGCACITRFIYETFKRTGIREKIVNSEVWKRCFSPLFSLLLPIVCFYVLFFGYLTASDSLKYLFLGVDMIYLYIACYIALNVIIYKLFKMIIFFILKEQERAQVFIKQIGIMVVTFSLFMFLGYFLYDNGSQLSLISFGSVIELLIFGVVLFYKKHEMCRKQKNEKEVEQNGIDKLS